MKLTAWVLYGYIGLVLFLILWQAVLWQGDIQDPLDKARNATTSTELAYQTQKLLRNMENREMNIGEDGIFYHGVQNISAALEIGRDSREDIIAYQGFLVRGPVPDWGTFLLSRWWGLTIGFVGLLLLHLLATQRSGRAEEIVFGQS